MLASNTFELNLLRPEKNREDTISALERETLLDFQRAMNRITFDTIVNKDPETFAFVSVPKTPEDKIPEKGCISEVPFYNFDKQFYNFSFVSLLTRKESIEALSKSRVECNRVSSMAMFQMPNKYMKIEEFEQTQTQQIAQVNRIYLAKTIKPKFNSVYFCSDFTLPKRQLD